MDEAHKGDALTKKLGWRFHFLLGSTTASNLSDGILTVGIPLLAVTLTKSPLEISAISAAYAAPWLLLSIMAGAVVDRGDRRKILLIAQSARITVLVIGLTASAMDFLSIFLLLILVFAFGVAEVFADNASAVLVPAVVVDERLNAANGRVLGAQQVANGFVGGPVAGFLVAAGGVVLFGVPVLLCFVALSLIVFGLKGVWRPQEESRGPALSEIREGVTFVVRHRVLRPLLICTTVSNLASAGYFAVLVLWIVGPQSVVGLAAESYGLLLAALALGAVLGSLSAERLSGWVSDVPLIGFMWMASGILLAVPVLIPRPWVIAGAFVLIGFSSTVGVVIAGTMRQRLVPDRLRGRVLGVARMLAYGMMPVGALLAGFGGQVIGLAPVFVCAAALSTLIALYFLISIKQESASPPDPHPSSSPKRASH